MTQKHEGPLVVDRLPNLLENDLPAGELLLRLVGSGYFEFFGRDLTDTDYLDLGIPASKRPRLQARWP